MLAHQRVVISNNTASLRVILVIIKLPKCKISKLALILLNVQNIRVSVHIFEAIGINLEQLLEPVKTGIKFLIVVERVSNLIHDEVRIFEKTKHPII